MTRARMCVTRRACAALVGSVALAGLSVLAATPPASAAVWLPEAAVTDGPADEIREITTATAPDGSFVMAWAENLDGGDSSWTVQVATRAPGASGFSTPVEAAPPGDGVFDVVLVVGTGATTVAWARQTATSSWVEVARRPAGADRFTDPETLGVPGSGTGDVVGVGDEQGRVTLLWETNDLQDVGFITRIHSATWEPVLADWSDPDVLGSGVLEPPVLAVDGVGTVTVAWTDSSPGGSVTTRTRRAGGTAFGSAQAVAPAGRVATLALAGNASGDTVLVWSQAVDSDYVLFVADREAGAATFDEPIDAVTTADYVDPEVAVDRTGTVTIAWVDPGAVPRVWAATAPRSGAFSAPVQVASGGVGTPRLLSLGSSADGAAVLVWIHRWETTSNSRVARAVYRPAGGDFGSPVDLTAPVVDVFDQEVAASVDGAGHAFVAWSRSTRAEDFQYRAYARVLDVVGPDLHDVVVPATATAGAGVAVSASATDRWSGPPSITWSFGDGGTGSGGSSSHVYAAAGSLRRPGDRDRRGRQLHVGDPDDHRGARAGHHRARPVRGSAQAGRPAHRCRRPTEADQLGASSAERRGPAQTRRPVAFGGHQALVGGRRRQRQDVLRQDLRAAAQLGEVPGATDRHRPRRQHLGHHHDPLPRRPRLTRRDVREKEDVLCAGRGGGALAA